MCLNIKQVEVAKRAQLMLQYAALKGSVCFGIFGLLHFYSPQLLFPSLSLFKCSLPNSWGAKKRLFYDIRTTRDQKWEDEKETKTTWSQSDCFIAGLIFSKLRTEVSLYSYYNHKDM